VLDPDQTGWPTQWSDDESLKSEARPVTSR
jgi:hypothetical protein